uniref:uncharacterized protein LOC120338761 isoform X1 n=2 Tax=Styela clava TaxID=7725 RepID=UPI001939E59A|nr:uncharacterized protein LOC120338761 isoform X1 [Styela clava]
MSHHADLSRAYYDSFKIIPNKNWKQFARTALQLDDQILDNIEYDYSNNINEQKIQMCKEWERQRKPLSVQMYNELVDKFKSDDLPVGSQCSFAQYDSIILIFDAKVLPQAEKAKQKLVEKCKDVQLLSCKGKLEDITETLNTVRKFTYRIFILTGPFQSNNLECFMELLKQQCEQQRNLFIARRLTAVHPEIADLPLRIVEKGMSAEEFCRIIFNFLEENLAKDLSTCQTFTGNDDTPVSHQQIGKPNLHIPEDENEINPVETIDASLFEACAKELASVGFPDCQYDPKHAYILVIGPVRENDPDLQCLVKIPWIRVFDFDPKSRVFGLLSNVEDYLRNRRYYTTTDTKDKVVPPVDKTTDWVFINGYCDSDDVEFRSGTDISDKLVFEHCDSLVKYCVMRKIPKIIVLWYPSNNNFDDSLDNFLGCMKHHFKSHLNSFPCIICVRSKPHKHSGFGHMVKRLKLETNLLVMPLNYICQWIKNSDNDDTPTFESKTLPQFSQIKGEKSSFRLTDKNFKWLSVCFDVLASNEAGSETNNVDLEGEDFLKGGKLRWEIIGTGKYDAERDILQDTVKLVKKQYIETGKSGIITIFHPPGGGGTTFARRVLWELRKEAPCLELFSLEISIDEVKNRLTFIRIETHLPAVLLVDGNSLQDVKTLLEYCRYEKVVIIHVQRFYSSFKNYTKKKKNIIFLPEHVSKTEAQFLHNIFSTVKPDARVLLKKLTDDVGENKSHCMFEYGLTAYDSEYRGVKSYVHGNLQIHPTTALENWHRILTYLSLAHYYGHCGLPCKIFANLLCKSNEQAVTLDDLPHQAKKLVIENSDGEWRITYYIVAKEILEQVLVKRQSPEYDSKERTLSHDARHGLCQIAVNFIRFVKENLISTWSSDLPTHIEEILTSILIKRNYKDAGENDEFGSKSKYSRLIKDTPTDDHKRCILENLVECFPANAEFHAHLGRFYGITKQFEKAEECFLKAFTVRNEEKKNKSDGHTNSGDPVLHRIHSMYGFYLNVQVKNEISEHKFTKQSVKTVLEKAEKAVKHFQASKNHYQKGCNPTYVYIGEIKVRLLLAEFAHALSSGNIANLQREEEPFCLLANFTLESFSHCDQLLVQCMYHAEEHNIPQDELDFCINNFNTFFKNAEMALRRWVGNDKTVHSKKCHVAILKMHLTEKKGVSSRFQIYEDVDKLQYLKQLIQLYEGIFTDAQQRDMEHHLISNYMIEWLQAIRHPLFNESDYALAQVNSRVENWNSKKERGSLATFYNYVLTTLLAINGLRGEVANAYSEISCRLKEKMKDCSIPLPLMDRTAEWLANHESTQSIRNIIHRNLLGEWDGKFWKKEKAARLKVCKGRISTCKIWYGHIVLDGGHRPEITLFFNPQRYGFSGSDSKQKQRVEFYVGFNPNHGAEAYQVSVLEKHICLKCKTPTEISKLGKEQEQWKGQCPKCENEVRPK